MACRWMCGSESKYEFIGNFSVLMKVLVCLQDEAEKVKKDEDGEADVAAVGSPLKSDDDDDIFSSYNSVF